MKNEELNSWTTKPLTSCTIAADYLRERQLSPLDFGPANLSQLVVVADARGLKLNKDHAMSKVADLARVEREKYCSVLLARTSTTKPNWMRAVVGDGWEEPQAVMDHWVWQIKRKMAGLRVENHLMPILVGKTGAGKSRLVENIVAALPAWFSTDFTFPDLADERAAAGLADRYIQVNDELANARRADVEALKRWLTAPTVSYRPMGTNGRMKTAQLGTAIGTSNHKIDEVIKDETSMRRFYQVEVLDRMDWDAINQIDWLDYFASIDHTAASPINAVLNSVKRHQAVLQRDSVAEWLADGVGAAETEIGGIAHYAAADLHQDYADFCRRNGTRVKTARGLAFDLERLGWERTRERRGSFWAPPGGACVSDDQAVVSVALDATCSAGLVSINNYKPVLNDFQPSARILELADKLRNNALEKQTKGEQLAARLIMASGKNFYQEQVLFISSDKYYRTDFLVDKKLAIEIDGKTHLGLDAKNKDLSRDGRLLELGIHTIRFSYQPGATNEFEFSIYSSNTCSEQEKYWTKVFSKHL